MRKIILSALSILTIASFNAQMKEVSVESKEYADRKAAGTLNEVIAIPAKTAVDVSKIPVYKGNTSKNVDNTPTGKASGCDCYVDPDGTYTLALGPTDDGSSGLINLPFSFNFYGQTFTSLYINNNGNITFGNAMGTFSSTAFPSSTRIIAPFWGDVDTRAGLGQVVYKIYGNAQTGYALYVNWENVGYYSQQGDKRNSFQAILTDGTHPSIIGGNVAFCYKDMNWTTGSASSGTNGFGGIPATAGINKGDNVTHFLIGRFNQPGTAYDGPLGNPDGIDYLDNKSYFLNITDPTNIPPVPSGIQDCDTIKICASSDTAYVPIYFLSPEMNQTTTSQLVSAIYLGNGQPSQIVSQQATIPGQTSTLILRLLANFNQVGFHQVTVSATDNHTNPGTTIVQFIVWVDDQGLQTMSPQITPNGSCGPTTLQVLNGPYDSYLWSPSYSILPTLNVSQSQHIGVTVSRNGCYKYVSEYIDIMPPLHPTISGNTFYCPANLGTQIDVNNPSTYSVIEWLQNGQVIDTTASVFLSAGTYQLHVVDSLGFCTKDTNIVITTQPFIQLENNQAICSPQYTFTQNIAGSGNGTWSFYGASTPFFTNFNSINQTVSFPDFGTYNMVYTDALCGDKDTVSITYGLPTPINLVSDFFVCPGAATENVYIADSASLSSVTWSTTPAINNIYNVNLPVGTYTVSVTSPIGCPNDTTFTLMTQPPLNLVNVGDYCGDTIVLNANTGAPFGNWSKVSGPGTAIFHQNIINPMISVDKYGSYEFEYNETNCNEKARLKINFIPNPYFELLDGETCDGDQFVFNAMSDVGFVQTANYVWTHNGSVVGSGPSYGATNQGTYTLTATNQCGVHQVDTYLKLEVCEVNFPNVFTPGGSEGSNDVFKLINSPSGFKTFSIKIFNRWGNLMHEITKPNEGWDGRVNGELASDGVYFYLMNAETISGRELVEQGYFHLVK